MKTISIKELKVLINARLENPKAFAGKSLVIWNSRYTTDSIVCRLVKQCCVEYDVANPELQKWVQYSDMCFTTDDYTQIQACPNLEDRNLGVEYGFKHSGILFNTGCFLNTELTDWLKFVNTHQNGKGVVSEDWALIACAQASSYDIKEEDFTDNCELYYLLPSADEFEYPSDQRLYSQILSFMDEKGLTGEHFAWEYLMNALDSILEEMGCEDLVQLSEDDYKREAKGYVISDVSEAFWNYLHQEK